MVKRRRANSLVELLVAMSVFLVLSTVIVLIYRAGRQGYEKTSAQSDPFRMAALARDQISAELSGAKLLCPPPGEYASLDFYQPDLLPETRQPRYQPGPGTPSFLLASQPSQLLTEPLPDGRTRLLRRGGNRSERRLAELGLGGSATFRVLETTLNERVIRITLMARSPNQKMGMFQLDASFVVAAAVANPPPPFDDPGGLPPPESPVDAAPGDL